MQGIDEKIMPCRMDPNRAHELVYTRQATSCHRTRAAKPHLVTTAHPSCASKGSNRSLLNSIRRRSHASPCTQLDAIRGAITSLITWRLTTRIYWDFNDTKISRDDKALKSLLSPSSSSCPFAHQTAPVSDPETFLRGYCPLHVEMTPVPPHPCLRMIFGMLVPRNIQGLGAVI